MPIVIPEGGRRPPSHERGCEKPSERPSENDRPSRPSSASNERCVSAPSHVRSASEPPKLEEEPVPTRSASEPPKLEDGPVPVTSDGDRPAPVAVRTPALTCRRTGQRAFTVEGIPRCKTASPQKREPVVAQRNTFTPPINANPMSDPHPCAHSLRKCLRVCTLPSHEPDQL